MELDIFIPQLNVGIEYDGKTFHKNPSNRVRDARKYDIVVEGNKAKFSQNDDLKEYLLSTGDAILVEASPYDRIWGIGLYPGQAAKGSIDQWRGLNLLGAALMEVRDWLREAR